eukprot:scaffold217_cov377-Prasinococcus_capsulatus_cf.AAC.28
MSPSPCSTRWVCRSRGRPCHQRGLLACNIAFAVRLPHGQQLLDRLPIGQAEGASYHGSAHPGPWRGLTGPVRAVHSTGAGPVPLPVPVFDRSDARP